MMQFTPRLMLAASTLAISSLTFANTTLHQPQHFQKILVVIFENMSYAEIKNEPTFKKLVEYSGNTLTENGHLMKLLKAGSTVDNTGNGYAFFSRYYNNHNTGVFPARPSQPNYIAMTSGSTHNITDNEIHNLNVDNLAMELNEVGLTWKVYAEDLPDPSEKGSLKFETIYSKKISNIKPYVNDPNKNEQENDIASHEYYIDAYKKLGIPLKLLTHRNCFTGEAHVDGQGGPYDGYMRKHEPFISYTNVQNNYDNCKNIVNGSHFKTDVENLGDVTFYIPNQIHDGHNGGLQERENNANLFLSSMLGTDSKTGEPLPNAEDAPFQKFMAQNGLLVITFDEPSVTGNPDMTIYTMLAGSMINSGAYPNIGGNNSPTCSSSAPFQCNHYNLLKLIEANWNLRGLEPQNTSSGYKTAFPLDNGLSGLWR